jgi:hypothetical protein
VDREGWGKKEEKRCERNQKIESNATLFIACTE